MNKQVLLASRPEGRVTEENFRIAEAPLGEPEARRGPRPERVAVARSVHARPDERREVLRRAGADRRGDGRPDRRQRDRVARPGLCSRRQGADAARLAALRRRESLGAPQDRCAARARLVLPRRPRDARHHGVVRPVRHRPAQSRRDARRFRGVGRGRERRRPAREDRRLPRRRHRGRPREVRLRRHRARLRRVHRLQGGRSAGGAACGLPGGRGRRLRERRRRDARHAVARDERALAHRRLRLDRRVQRDGALSLQEYALGARQPDQDAGDDRLRLDRTAIPRRSRDSPLALPRESSSIANR